MKRIAGITTLISLLAVGCEYSLPTGVGEVRIDARKAGLPSARGHGSGRVAVMTRNVYVGADVDRILAGSLSEIPQLVSEAFQEFVDTDFATRMDQLAVEIEQTQPHLIGLQEVTLIDAFFATAPPQQFDFLEALLGALDARGLDYRLVAQANHTDLTLPADPTVVSGLVGVRFLDADAILARGDVEVSNPTIHRYGPRLGIPGTTIEVLRGFAAVDARVGRRTYRFVTTHLEPAPVLELLPIQLGQVQELVSELTNETLPLIVTGDFNTPAHLGRGNAPTYDVLLDAGYIDVWTRRPPGQTDAGFTCCHDLDLLNPTPDFSERIDLIFARNPRGIPRQGIAGAVQAVIVGDEQETRDRFGMWPSDHGGVVARLQIPVPADAGGP